MSLFNSLIQPSNGACAAGEKRQARRPSFEVEETDAAYGLTVYLPGVSKDAVEITDEDGELRVSAKRAPGLPEGSEALYRETSDTPFELVLAHDNTVDGGKIGAELKDGVLKLTLAKAESAKPRKISVN
ncbi:MAG TPA: Hsp20/alpha crystallin family protein [Opitutaceae bacterium]